MRAGWPPDLLMAAGGRTERIRVLIVDDSAPIRMLLQEALDSDSAISVVGTAPDGEQALHAVRSLSPDAIVLDLEMPVMDGLEFLEQVRVLAPRLPVVVFSSLSSHGAEITLRALWAGASDYVTKPRARTLTLAREAAAAELVPRIKAFVERERERSARAADAARGPAPRDATPQSFERPPGERPTGERARHRPRAVVIAASTGGPKALADLLARLPADFHAPILVAQHMPPMFTGYLAHGLSSQCALRVSEGYPGAHVAPGQVWIAPGGQHMVVRMASRGVEIALHQGPHENGCRPSADPLFRSVADVYGHGALAVVLTGMGQDGMLGAHAISERGGTVIAQDEVSSVIWGMPGSVVRAGLADRVLPLDAIAEEIVTRCDRGRRRAA